MKFDTFDDANAFGQNNKDIVYNWIVETQELDGSVYYYLRYGSYNSLASEASSLQVIRPDAYPSRKDSH